MKNFRKQWGLTQEELAALIGVTRGVLAMYESGRRQLPVAAGIKLGELQVQLLSAQKARQPATLQQRQAVQLSRAEKQLNDKARRAALEAARTTRLLDTMRQRYQQLQQKMTLIQLTLPAALPGSLQKTALLYMEAKLMDELERCAPARQALVAYKLSACRALEGAALNACSFLKQE